MSTIHTKIVRPRFRELSADISVFHKLEAVPQYDPKEPVLTIDALRGAFEDILTSQAEYDKLLGAFKAARDKRTRAEAEFHDLLVRARCHAHAQFGLDAAVLHTIGLKRKSDRTPRKRKAKSTPAAMSAPAPSTPPADTPTAGIKPAA